MEILYHYVDKSYSWGWGIIPTIAAVALALWILIVIIDKVRGKSYDDNTRFFAGCCLVIILFTGIVSASGANKTTYDVYKVTVDETAIDYTEFLNIYEIIDQEGKIYTIKYRN